MVLDSMDYELQWHLRSHLSISAVASGRIGPPIGARGLALLLVATQLNLAFLACFIIPYLSHGLENETARFLSFKLESFMITYYC